MKSTSGITRIEVLLIIVVLAIFFALMLPGPRPGFDNSRRASAKNDVVQIATAITAYETEYGRVPSTNGDVQDVGGPILQALLGMDTNLNRRQIVFLEIQTARKGKGGLSNGVYVDPWGFPYKMKLDVDGSKFLTNVGPASTLKAKITGKVVAVWNDPDYHADWAKPDKKKKRAVTSWD